MAGSQIYPAHAGIIPPIAVRDFDHAKIYPVRAGINQSQAKCETRRVTYPAHAGGGFLKCFPICLLY